MRSPCKSAYTPMDLRASAHTSFLSCENTRFSIEDGVPTSENRSPSTGAA